MYDSDFFVSETREAMIAARAIMPWVALRTNAKSAIDVGCGTGAWLSMAKFLGLGVYGVDGNAPDDSLLIDAEEFERADISSGIDCAGYDLAICLEVGEHIPVESAQHLVSGLCKAKYVLWSAAVPGQNGVNHINEQWPTWWAEYFRDEGYFPSCGIREVFWDDTSIAPFYRQNIMTYARPVDLLHAGLIMGLRNDVHPENPHIAAFAG